jgi:hypothetical protein
VLKVAPWGRTLSIASGSLGIVAYVAWILGAEFQIPVLGILAYSVVLIVLFFTPNWKATFGAGPGELPTMESAPAPMEASEPPEVPEPSEASEVSESDETREAA